MIRGLFPAFAQRASGWLIGAAGVVLTLSALVLMGLH